MSLQSLCDRALWFHQSGNQAEAEQLYLQVLAAEPENFTACHLLGVLRLQQGRNGEALKLLGAALKINPDDVALLSNYGNALKSLGHLDEALASYDKAIAIKPDYAKALNNRGLTLLGMKRFEEALASYDKALAVKPGYAEALYNRGISLWNLKRTEEAVASYDKALAVKPDYAEALYNRGVALSDLKCFTEALASYDKALGVQPDYAKALNNRGISLWNLERPVEALASYDKALAVQPDYTEALYNRGVTLLGLKCFDAALTSFEKVLAINPDHAEALYFCGDVLRNLKRFEEALACYEKTLAITPDHPYAFGGVANAALNLCDWLRATRIAGEIESRLDKAAITPLTLLGYSDDAALQLRCAKRFTANRIPARAQPLWDGTIHRNGKIKIAYLSADFYKHAIAYLTAELFERHDRSRFEVIAISSGPDDGSKMRARLVSAFDCFIDVRNKSDREVASFLKESKVDIAVDLTGHTQDGRLGILSHRPCPVQVNYLGFPGTLGADFIDYIIADKFILPMQDQIFYTEKIVHLPDSYQANDSKRVIAAQAPSRKEAGLPEQGFVFCCFNNNWKITAPLFEIWMRLLSAVPGSVLWLIDDQGGARRNLCAEAAIRGGDPKRLVFAAKVSPDEHLARHQLADLFLDTLPYNAHTTASDALWTGLPLVTCLGKAFAGRVAASLLYAIGLPELVTPTLEEYENLALKLARDSSFLNSFQQRLAQNRSSYPLFDADRFRRNIEAAYTRMWEIAGHGEAPQSFSVSPE